VVRVVRDHESYGVSPGDLAQEGSIGLMKAVRRFDPSRGVRLGAYAVRWIEAEVREYIAHNWRLVRLGSSTAMKKLFFGYRQTVAALRQWGEERDVAPTTQAVADALNLSPAQVARAEAFFRGQDLTLAPSAEEDGDSGAQVQDRWGLQVWTQEGHLTPQERLAEEDLTAFRHRTLDAALAQLPERDRAIFTARRLQEPAEGLAHLGERFQISAERVRQIEARALAQVSQTLRPQAALLQGDEAV
jgi:RNA polymerase sigma-32 factor